MVSYAQLSRFQSNSFDFKTTEAGASAEHIRLVLDRLQASENKT
jgi:hypothetical protein